MVITWWIIGFAAFILFVTLYKSQDTMAIFSLLKRNIFVILIVGVILFASFSLYKVSVNNNLSFNNFNDFLIAGKTYFLWVKSIIGNFGEVTGYAVQQDWVLNSTNITK